MQTTTNDQSIFIRDTTANPAPIGLLGFGMTTILLNLHNAGYFELNSMVIGMGIFMGGVAQLIAGVQEWKKNNTFGATAFTAYGAFWLSLVVLWLLPKTAFGAAYKSSEDAVAWYLLLWGVFTLFMFIATLRASRLLQVIFLSLTILFFLLAASDFSGNTGLRTFAGYEGIFCGLSALYGSVAQVLNEAYGKTVLPVGVRK